MSDLIPIQSIGKVKIRPTDHGIEITIPNCKEEVVKASPKAQKIGGIGGLYFALISWMIAGVVVTFTFSRVFEGSIGWLGFWLCGRFDYGLQTISFGKHLDAAEAEQLIKRLSAMLTFRCHTVEHIIFGTPQSPIHDAQTVLENPDVTELTFPFGRLKEVIIDAATHDFYQVERDRLSDRNPGNQTLFEPG